MEFYSKNLTKIKGIFGKKKLELPDNATNKQKGNFGEIQSNNNFTKNKKLKDKGYDLEDISLDGPPKGLDDKIVKGIDGIYKNNTPPPKYVIDESKFGTSKLGKTKDGPQMSDDWIKGSNRLENKVGADEAKKIKDAMRKGEVDKVVSKIDDTGNVQTYRVDKNRKITGLWP